MARQYPDFAYLDLWISPSGSSPTQEICNDCLLARRSCARLEDLFKGWVASPVQVSLGPDQLTCQTVATADREGNVVKRRRHFRSLRGEENCGRGLDFSPYCVLTRKPGSDVLRGPCARLDHGGAFTLSTYTTIQVHGKCLEISPSAACCMQSMIADVILSSRAASRQCSSWLQLQPQVQTMHLIDGTECPD